MKNANTDTAPLVKNITVPWPVDEAFRRFTDGIGHWWPLATHSVLKEKEKVTACAFEAKVGGRIYETGESRETSLWGTVIAVEAPSMVRFTWHPGREPDTAQEVEVRFSAHEDGTRVVLTHSGWDKLGKAAAATRKDYDSGWDFVLAHYTESAPR